jgi:hypothetical protein
MKNTEIARYLITTSVDGERVAETQRATLTGALRAYDKEVLFRDSGAARKPTTRGKIQVQDRRHGYAIVAASVWKTGYGWATEICKPVEAAS